MKKLLLSIALLLLSGATMAQKVVTKINTERCYTLCCKATDHGGFIGIDENGNVNGRSTTAGYVVTFETADTENGYYIKVGNLYLNAKGNTVTPAETKSTVWILGVPTHTAGVVTFKCNGTTNYLNNNQSSSPYLKANNHTNGPGSGNACSLWVMCEEDPNYKVINDPADFVNGEVYTFITSRGWMGAKDDNDKVISTVYSANGITASDALAEDANFHWTVYKSANNKYYLYNIGKEMFMGVQTANNTAVPFSETPQGIKLTFKKSSNTAYPIMFSTDNAGVVNHSGNHASGLITWTGGWTNLADDGSNHKIEKVAILDDTTLAGIASIVEEFEKDRTDIVHQGKYYRIAYNFNGTVKYIQGEASNVSGKANGMLMTADKGAASVFYYGNDRLLSYTAGKYVKEDGGTRGLQAIGTDGGAIEFIPGSGDGIFAIKSPSYMHANTSGEVCFIDHCGGPGCAAHNLIIEEVETLPVSISAAGMATFFAPVAVEIAENVKAYTVTINGEWATLNEITNGVIPANTGVVLEGAAGTYDFAITTANAFEGENALLGTAAAAYIAEDAYVLGYINVAEEGEAEKMEVGFYTAAKNQQEGTSWKNNSHKAYLPKAAGMNAVSYSFRFGEGTTGLEEVKAENGEVKTIYDLTGRRVEAITAPGIYIVGGKKVLVK